jgi:hypothetical protein
VSYRRIFAVFRIVKKLANRPMKHRQVLPPFSKAMLILISMTKENQQMVNRSDLVDIQLLMVHHVCLIYDDVGDSALHFGVKEPR